MGRWCWRRNHTLGITTSKIGMLGYRMSVLKYTEGVYKKVDVGEDEEENGTNEEFNEEATEEVVDING